MSSIINGCAVRDGFTSAHGRFLAPYQVDRVEGARLKELFLPRLTPEANKLLRDKHDFVGGQLKHYGVQYEPHEYTGQGTNLLKKALEAGKCDKVPEHILKLEAEMHREWLATRSPEDLASHPEHAMQKYFVDLDGKPDRTVTTGVIGFPLPAFSSYRVSQLCSAAAAVAGLHQATGYGPSTQTIYLGWDKSAVDATAKKHGAKERAEKEEAATTREKQRAAKHAKYVASVRGKTGTPLLVGQYMIDCPEIENGWSSARGRDLTLSIKTTKMPGVFLAHFDFSILEGVMMLSADEDKLAFFAEEEDEDEDEDDEEEEAATSNKRKAGKGRGAPKAKKSKKKGESGKYFLLMRSRETGEGQMNPTPAKGTITFPAPIYTSFTGKADMSFVGRDVEFTARKISSVPAKSYEKWEDYSWSAYEDARVSRWG